MMYGSQYSSLNHLKLKTYKDGEKAHVFYLTKLVNSFIVIGPLGPRSRYLVFSVRDACYKRVSYCTCFKNEVNDHLTSQFYKNNYIS